MKPGTIIYSQPGVAVMYLNDNEYLIGEKVVSPHYPIDFELLKALEAKYLHRDLDVTGDFRFGFMIAFLHIVHHLVLSDQQARGYAFAMHVVDEEPRLSMWAMNQKNPDNLFAVHPYIENLMRATAHGADEDIKRLRDEFIAKFSGV